jgi:hypothetical protein
MLNPAFENDLGENALPSADYQSSPRPQQKHLINDDPEK